MASDDPILRQLRSLDGPAVEDAVLRAIDLSGPEDQVRLAGLLLERASPRGLGGLVARWHKLPEALRGQLRGRVNDLAAGLRACISSTSRQTRLNVLDLIGGGQRAELAYLAVLVLADPDRQVGDVAAMALRRFVDQFQARPRPAPPEPSGDPAERLEFMAWDQARQQVLAAVRTAVIQFESHLRPVALECAILLAGDLSDLLAPLLAQVNNRTATALVQRATEAPYLARAAVPFYYLALSVPATRHRFAARISQLRDPLVLGELIGQVHRIDDPDVARGVAAVKRMVYFERAAWWERFPDERARSLTVWIAAMGAEAEQKARWLCEMVWGGSAAQRAAALDQLCRWTSDEALVALKKLTGHPDFEVADRAATELVRRGDRTGPDPDALLMGRLNHPDEHVRLQAGEELARIGFERFWAQFPRLPEQVRRFAAGKLCRLVADLPGRLAGKLEDPDPEQRLQAARVADLCGLAAQLGQALFARCTDSNSKVRSAAVKMLGQVPSPRSIELATAALNDPDRRVRANAVEALDALRRENAAAVLLGMLSDRDNRIRANAIKALMDMDLASARQSLERMLSDPSPGHRLSALWVVEQVSWFKPAQRVLDLARQDPDRRVRARALRALGELRRLYRRLRARPAARARTPQPDPMEEVTT